MSLPKFRTDLKISFHRESDGTETVILKEPVAEKFFRLSVYEYELLRNLNGRVSLEQAVELLKARGMYCPLEEATLIISRAAQYGLVIGTPVNSAAHLKSLKERIKKGSGARRLSGYYFMTIPLWNPDAFLTRTLRIFTLLCNRWTGLLMALAAPAAIYLVVTGYARIEREYLFFFNWQNLVCLWVVIVFAKLLHEFSHAYTAKRFGLYVPQMGVAFLLFMPCLFCDTTDAWRLADRRQRMAISAAGIIAEACIAVISAYAWYFTRPGIVNSVAFYLMTVSLISTVIFNGNPLIKFDGYFILMDYLRIPNLATKSVEHIKYLFMNRVMGIATAGTQAQSPREVVIFTTYGLSALTYRVFLYAGIVAGVYYRFDKFLGILLAVPAFGLFVVKPLINGLRNMYGLRQQIRPRLKGAAVFAVLVGFLTLLLFGSWPGNATFPCYVASSHTQKITVPIPIPVKQVFVKDGTDVAAGQMLFRLDTTVLELAVAERELERATILKQIDLLRLNDDKRAQADGKRIELLKVEDEIGRLQEKLALAGEGIIAPFDGVVTSWDWRMQEGFKPGEGVVVGELESRTRKQVRALIPEEELAKVSAGQMVTLWLPLGTGCTLKGPVSGIRPYSEKNLANSPFSSRFGGSVATEVKADNEMDAPLTAYYECSVSVQGTHDLPLGLTGKMIVPSPRTSIMAKLIDDLVKTFNRESLL